MTWSFILSGVGRRVRDAWNRLETRARSPRGVDVGFACRVHRMTPANLVTATSAATGRGPAGWSTALVAGLLVAAAGSAACGTGGTYPSDEGDPDAAELDTGDSVGVGEAFAVLEPDERVRWAGEWFEESSELESNVYDRLDISVDERGFEYSRESREVPYGPNSEWSGGHRAVFMGPYSAMDETTGHVFSLRVDPSDPDVRTIGVSGGRTDESPAGDAPGAWAGPAEHRYVFNRPVYQAGFDCAEAATSIETEICHDELLATADLEMNLAYRDLIGDMAGEQQRRLRDDQRRFLRERSSRCEVNDVVDSACLMRHYEHRLAALRVPPEVHAVLAGVGVNAERGEAGVSESTGGLVTRDRDGAVQERGWCGSGATVVTSFQTYESGRTASLCRDDGGFLTYTFGRLGDEPESVYSGPVLGEAVGTAVMWGDVSSLAELVASGGWRADPVVRQLAQARDTHGFFSIESLTGIYHQSVYVFRRSGWEYAIIRDHGRGQVDPDMKEDSHSVTVRSPGGGTYSLVSDRGCPARC